MRARQWVLHFRVEGSPDEDHMLVDFELRQIGQKVRAALTRASRYPGLVDRRVSKILQLSAEALFDIRRVVIERLDVEATSAIAVCGGLGELVIDSSLVSSGELKLCRPCSGQ